MRLRIIHVVLLAITNAMHPPPFSNMSDVNGGACQIEDNNLERWRDSDRVEVYLGEYAMQHVGLNAWLGFASTHMAVVYQNTRINKWYVMDRFAKSAQTISNIVMPSIPPNSWWNRMNWIEKFLTYIRGGLVDLLVWDNAGFVRLREDKTDEFQNLEHLGAVNGSQVKEIRSWVVNDYTKQSAQDPFTFDMWQLYNSSSGERIRKSRMCHDFVEDVLARLDFIPAPQQDEEESDDSFESVFHSGTNGVSSFRDSLNLNVSSYEFIDISNPKIRRDYQRFLRFFRNHIYEATRDMNFARVTATKFITFGLPLILPLEGGKYFRVHLAEEGTMNYCRMPMDLNRGQPYVPSKLDDPRKLCALPHFIYNEFKHVVKFSLFDYLILIEQRLDDAISGKDGEGADPWLHFRFVLESTAIVFGLTKLFKWLTRKHT